MFSCAFVKTVTDSPNKAMATTHQACPVFNRCGFSILFYSDNFDDQLIKKKVTFFHSVAFLELSSDVCPVISIQKKEGRRHSDSYVLYGFFH